MQTKSDHKGLTPASERIVSTLAWMIAEMQYHQRELDPNPEWGHDPEWSPEMQEAMALQEYLKTGRIVAREVAP